MGKESLYCICLLWSNCFMNHQSFVGMPHILSVCAHTQLQTTLTIHYPFCEAKFCCSQVDSSPQWELMYAKFILYRHHHVASTTITCALSFNCVENAYELMLDISWPFGSVILYNCIFLDNNYLIEGMCTGLSLLIVNLQE